MIYLSVAIDFFILIGVMFLVFEATKKPIERPIGLGHTSPRSSPFSKPKKKPIALDDDAAYELEQKSKRGPQP